MSRQPTSRCTTSSPRRRGTIRRCSTSSAGALCRRSSRPVRSRPGSSTTPASPSPAGTRLASPDNTDTVGEFRWGAVEARDSCTEGSMSLRPMSIDPIPEETVRVARAAFPKGNLFIRMRDELGVIFTDPSFSELYPSRGQPALAPWRLALVTLMQFVENLSDRQAADSVRSRIDWKYVLGLMLTDPGFDFSVLSEFRTRLIDGNYEQRLLDTMLAQLEERGVLKARGQQRTDATHVLAAIRPLNRLEMVGETMRAALNELAVAAPAWLLEHSRPEWLERYGVRVDVYRLPKTEGRT